MGTGLFRRGLTRWASLVGAAVLAACGGGDDGRAIITDCDGDRSFSGRIVFPEPLAEDREGLLQVVPYSFSDNACGEPTVIAGNTTIAVRIPLYAGETGFDYAVPGSRRLAPIRPISVSRSGPSRASERRRSRRESS